MVPFLRFTHWLALLVLYKLELFLGSFLIQITYRADEKCAVQALIKFRIGLVTKDRLQTALSILSMIGHPVLTNGSRFNVK